MVCESEDIISLTRSAFLLAELTCRGTQFGKPWVIMLISKVMLLEVWTDAQSISCLLQIHNKINQKLKVIN